MLQLTLSLMSCLHERLARVALYKILYESPDLWYPFFTAAPLELDPKPTLKWLNQAKLVNSVSSYFIHVHVHAQFCLSNNDWLFLICNLSHLCSFYLSLFQLLRILYPFDLKPFSISIDAFMSFVCPPALTRSLLSNGIQVCPLFLAT